VFDDVCKSPGPQSKSCARSLHRSEGLRPQAVTVVWVGLGWVGLASGGRYCMYLHAAIQLINHEARLISDKHLGILKRRPTSFD
jgi:hypothetical protein